MAKYEVRIIEEVVHNITVSAVGPGEALDQALEEVIPILEEGKRYYELESSGFNDEASHVEEVR